MDNIDPVVLLGIAAALALIAAWTWRYYTTHKPCIDCTTRTKRIEDGAYLCGMCSGHREELRLLEEKRAKEPEYLCPAGHGVMEKPIVGEPGSRMIIDKCKSCEMHLLSADEIARIRQEERDRGYNQGQSDRSSQQAATNAIIGAAVMSSMMSNSN